MNADNGGPAFPVNNIAESKTGEYVQLAVQSGMSLRDWFAGMALQGLLAHIVGISGNPPPEGYAKRAYEYADAMLAEREK